MEAQAPPLLGKREGDRDGLVCGIAGEVRKERGRGRVGGPVGSGPHRTEAPRLLNWGKVVWWHWRRGCVLTTKFLARFLIVLPGPVNGEPVPWAARKPCSDFQFFFYKKIKFSFNPV